MEIEKLISSGIIEMYCMGLASDEEILLVEKLAVTSKEVRDEITSVYEALHLYTIASQKSPAASLKDKILNAIIDSDSVKNNIAFPSRLTRSSSINEWKKYFVENKIASPLDFDQFHVLDLPGNDKQFTYIAWAKKGAVLEESHEEEDEFLFMLQGQCSVTIDGKIGFYKEGDLVYVPKKCIHRAEATSDGIMILIGQRVAA